MIIHLKGRTQKGKNRIQENGERWEVIEERLNVLFSPEYGPWILICPVDSKKNIRWIKEKNDSDFEIVKIEE